MMYREKHILNMGNGDYSAAQCYVLVSSLMRAIEQLSGMQQPAMSTESLQEGEDRLRAEFADDIEQTVRSIAMALTGKQIQFVANANGSNYAQTTAEEYRAIDRFLKGNCPALDGYNWKAWAYYKLLDSYYDHLPKNEFVQGMTSVGLKCLKPDGTPDLDQVLIYWHKTLDRLIYSTTDNRETEMEPTMEYLSRE